MSDSNVRYVGLDVHKRVVEACLLSPNGQIIRRDRLALSRSYLEPLPVRCCGRPIVWRLRPRRTLGSSCGS